MRELTDLEFDILMILADNKGHALWELVTLLGKEKSNLIITMNRLEEEIDLTKFLKFEYYDIINIDSFELKFRDPKDKFSKYIREQLRPDTPGRLDSSTPDFSLLGGFELDKLLDDPHLFDETRFEHVALSEKIQELISKRPEGQDLRYLNRLLLEEAYPDEISKGIDSIIYKGMTRKTTNPNSKQPKHHEIPYFINHNVLVFKYILKNIKLIGLRSFRKHYKKQQDQLENLKEKFEWQHISEEEYKELKYKIEYELFAEEDDDEAQKNTMRINNIISSQYALEFVKRFGFKWMVYGIHGMVGGWDACWPLGESAINRGVIKNETDLECAKRLIKYHKDVEEGFRRLGEIDEEDDGDIEAVIEEHDGNRD